MKKNSKLEGIVPVSNFQLEPNAESEQHVKDSLQRLHLLTDASHNLVQTNNPLELLNRIYDGLANAFGLDFYFYFSIDADKRNLKLRAWRGITEETAKNIETLKFGEAVCGVVARDLTPMILTEVQKSDEPVTQFIRSLGIKAYACYPLITNKQLIGTLSFGTKHQETFSKELIETIRALTDMFAIAIARKRAEDTLAGRARLLDLSKDAIIVRDKEDRVTFWNHGAEALYGWTEKEALGKLPYKLLHTIYPEPLEQIRKKFDRNKFWEGEIAQTTKDGKCITVLARWAVDRNPKGEEIGVIQSHTDITERKKVEQSLDESLARLRLVIEGAPNGMVMVDGQGMITMVNQQMEKLFGYTREEMIGQPIEHLLPARYRKTHPAQRQSFFHAPQARAMGHGRDLFARRKDGSEFPVEVGLNPAETPEGKVVLAAVIDITQRKKMERELTKAHEELENRARNLEATVAERTAHLQETIAELEGVSYSLSHDMRAPLRTMQSFSQIVLAQAGEKLDPMETDLLKKTISAASRLDRLIQDVLMYSRVARESVELKTVNIEDLLQQIIHERPDFQLPKAKIDIELPLEPVCAHEAYLTQCITNLLDNAVKFIPPDRQPTIRIWNEITDNKVRLWFADNGIGIPKEAKERVFGLFQRVHGERVYPGTGIGLSIVRKAIERMDGAAGVESETGTGSQFWIELKRGKNL